MKHLFAFFLPPTFCLLAAYFIFWPGAYKLIPGAEAKMKMQSCCLRKDGSRKTEAEMDKNCPMLHKR